MACKFVAWKVSPAMTKTKLPISQMSNQNTAAEVDAVLAAIPEPAHSTLVKLREMIRVAAPANATEEIGYGVPAFRAGELLAGYNAGKKFCSYYPMSGRVIHDLAADLAGYETTSGSIHFPIDKPLPAALVKKLVKARLAQIEAKIKTKAKPKTEGKSKPITKAKGIRNISR
jgi:uncharacterized protein YdhG (YjbR/CyaY superfamily)